jgi:hypothetical protein
VVLAWIKTLIRVDSERQIIRHNLIEERETRYYISSLSLTAKEFSQRIRGYWGVENKLHYVRDVTQEKIGLEFAPYLCLRFCQSTQLYSICIVTKCLKTWRKLNGYALLV